MERGASVIGDRDCEITKSLDIKNPDIAKNASESRSSDTDLIRTIDLERGVRKFNLKFLTRARFPPGNKYGTQRALNRFRTNGYKKRSMLFLPSGQKKRRTVIGCRDPFEGCGCHFLTVGISAGG